MSVNELNTLVTCYAGSLAYGTNIETSDVDIRGIFCADEKFHRTPFFNMKEVGIPDEEDGKLYELNNFMRLYVDMNPNILELLWVDDRSIITSSQPYEYLRDNRDWILSSKVAFTFSGYAMQQMKRIKGHNKWINNPQPEARPERKDFIKLIHNYTEGKVFQRDFDVMDYQEDHMFVPYGGGIYGIINDTGRKLFNKDGNVKSYEVAELDTELKKQVPMFIVKLCDVEYKKSKETWSNYWTWVKNRNETRHSLEEQFGYDTKHAMHIVRLMRMGKEILETGRVNVYRPDAQELLDIRRGKWSYEELLDWSVDMDNRVRGELYKNTSLPKKVDINKVSNLLMEVQNMCWDL